MVGNKVKGEIRVGYLDDKHELLPDEQKMLDEIGRTLNVALERKEYRERLALKQEEEAEFNRRLAELSAEIEARTRELEEQKTKLGGGQLLPGPGQPGLGGDQASGWRRCSRRSPTRWC